MEPTNAATKKFEPARLTAALVFVMVVGLGIPYPCAALAHRALRLAGTDSKAHPWSYLHLAEAYQLVIALGLIWVVRRWSTLDFGLRWPKVRTYFVIAAVWAIVAGVVMTFVDYAPQIVARVAPPGPYAFTPSNVLGWLSFEGITAGVSEEILYRGLLLAVLTASLPGRVRIRGYEMNAAGIVLAFIFAFAHVFNFWHRPFWIATGQQAYALGLGVLYAYWREKSGSVAPSILTHNLGDVVEGILGFAMAAVWGR